MRRLAAEMGRSPSAVHDELRRLVVAGTITMASGPKGTDLALRRN
jgi:predicted transcriptional regulator